jgi:uncharacterized lipoprotein YddW (UPF0748 family)
MRAPLVLVVTALALLLAPRPAVRAQGPADATASATDDIRGLWVQRTSLTSPQKIATMVAAARDNGFNTLLVQVRGRGEAYYDSAIEPRASDLESQPAGFDPLATVLQLAHQSGLRVHAWINVDLVSSAATLPRSREHVVARHPEWLMVPKTLAGSLAAVDPQSPEYVGTLARWTRGQSDTIEGLYLSPIDPAARDYQTRVVSEIAAKYPVDGIHLDYLRYPSDDFDYSARALDAFRTAEAASVPAVERDRVDALRATDRTAWTKQFPDAWRAFHRDRLTDLMKRIRAAIHQARPSAIVSAAVAPDPDDAKDHRLQDWRAWANAGDVDAICPMIYTADPADFQTALTRASRGVGDRTPLWVGIGAYRLPAAAAGDRVRDARRAGAAGVLLFSYDNINSAADPHYLTSIRPILLEKAGRGLR